MNINNKYNFVINLKRNRKLIFEKRKLKKLEKNKIRIRLKKVGVCASDFPRAYLGEAYGYPLVMGHEMAGEIYQSNYKKYKVKEKVSIFPLIPCKICQSCKKNDFVHCHSYSYYGSRVDGGFAKFIDVYPWNIFKLPKKVKLSDAFAMEPAAVALNTVNKTFYKKPKINQKVLVVGSGFIGQMIMRIIKIKFKKINLTILDRNRHKLNLSPKKTRKFLISQKTDLEKFVKNKMNFFDYVIETTGSSDFITHSVKLLNHNGILTLMGNINSDVDIKKNLVNQILRKEVKILGIWNSKFDKTNNDDWTDVLKLLKKGFKPSNLVSHWIKLDETPKYFRKIFEHKKSLKKFKFLKLVISND